MIHLIDAIRDAPAIPSFLFQDNLTTLDAYTPDAYAFVDIPGRDIAMPNLKTVLVTAGV